MGLVFSTLYHKYVSGVLQGEKMAVIFNFPMGTTIGPVKRRKQQDDNKEQIDRIIEKLKTLVQEAVETVEACRTTQRRSRNLVALARKLTPAWAAAVILFHHTMLR